MKNFFYTLIIIAFFSCASTKAQNYKTHKVKSGETIEAIARKYSVSVFDIYKLNPDAKGGNINENEVLIIPKSIIANKTITTEENKVVKYRRHKVKRKETLYGLSKRYGIFVEDIKKHNTFLYANQLKKGNILKIPIYEKKITSTKPKTSKYIVRPGEGKWRIAYTYGISVPELEALNPGMPEVLQAGQILNVPNKDKNTLQYVDENQYKYYTVLPQEGFYRLKVKLGVDQEELERLNPILKQSGLKEGMVLKVPLSTRFNVDMTQGEVIVDTLTTIPVEQVSVDLTKREISYDAKNIAIMLPFKSAQVDLSNTTEAKNKINKDPFLSRSLDFYSGALMALNDLEKLGVTVKVDVYDTENSQTKVQNILASNSFSTLDAVIGPLMPKTFNLVSSNLQSYSVPVVSPVTKNVTMRRNVFQSRPSESLLEDKLINHFKVDTTSFHVVIVSDAKNKSVSDKLKKEFPEAKVVYSRKDPKTEKDKFYIIDEDIVELLLPGNNLVFLETQNSGFVSNVTSILNSLINDEVKITLATTNMNKKAYENEDVSNYHLSNLQLHFPAIAKMYNENEENSFARNYKKKYGIAPNAFAVRGYDLTMDVVLRIVTSDNLYASVNDAPLTSYLENKFAYQTTGTGYKNSTVYLVKYDDLEIVEVKD